MKAIIRNILGVETADLPIKDIALVAGLNGAGKSSLLEAVAAGVTGDFATRGARTKKDAATLLRDGFPAGSVTLDWGDGAQRVSYPEGELKTKGEPRRLGTALGIGATRWMGLDAKTRAREMAERLHLEPTIDDLKKFFVTQKHEVHADTIDAVWRLIEAQGWDGAEKKAREKATKARGAWESVAVQQFGSKKAAEWIPTILRDTQIFSQDAADKRVADAKATVEQLLVAGALSGAEVKRIRTAAEDLGPAQARETTARAALATADAAAEKLAADLAKLPVLDTAPHTFPCPHCAKPVLLRSKPGGGGVLSLDKPPAEVSADALKANRIERQAIEQALAKEREKITKAQADAQAAVAAVRAAEAATARLVEIDAMPKANDEAIAEARAAQAEAEAVAEAVKDWAKAKAHYEEWALTQPIIEALAATGVRAVRVAEAIAEFNRRLGLISEKAGFAPVALTDTSDLTLSGRAYPLLSESEKWRCDMAMTLALAALERPVVVLVDRLDILNPQARPGVFEALREVGVPALVGYTAKDAASLPKLEAHGYGRTYWLENARLAPVA